MFNHDKIAKIFHLGLSDDEEKEFKKKLNDFLNNSIQHQTKSSSTDSMQNLPQRENSIDTLEI